MYDIKLYNTKSYITNTVIFISSGLNVNIYTHKLNHTYWHISHYLIYICYLHQLLFDPIIEASCAE